MLLTADYLLCSTSLGVGAALPAHSAHSTLRDVARLKGNLLKGSSTSLKRSRDQYLSGTLPSSSNQNASKDDSGDEEDSRAGMIGAISIKEKTSSSVNPRLAIFNGKGKKKKKSSKSDSPFAAPLPPQSQNASSSSNISSRIPYHSPSPPIRQRRKPTSPVALGASLSPTSRAFPNPFDPEQSPPSFADASATPFGSTRLSPSYRRKDVALEPSLTSSTLISSEDITETDTDDPRDFQVKQRSEVVQAGPSRKRKRRRKNRDKSNKDSLPDGQRTDPPEGL